MLYAQEAKNVLSYDGSCQVTVPAVWKVTEGFGIADAPNKSMEVAVSSPKSTATLAGLKQSAQMIYTKDKVVKAMASEFQMEGQGVSGKPNVYRGIQIPGKVCIVEVTYSSGTINDARKIAESLKAAK